MYILLVNSETHKHKQRHCTKVIDHGTHLVVWSDNSWEIVEKTDYTSFSTGDNDLLSRSIESWEWEKWHEWNACQG